MKMLISESALKSLKAKMMAKKLGSGKSVAESLATMARKMVRQSKRETKIDRPKEEPKGETVANGKTHAQHIFQWGKGGPGAKAGKLPASAEHLKHIYKIESATEHTRSYIDSVIEAVAIHGTEEIAVAKLFEAAPSMTSTGLGQFAVQALSAIVENEVLAKSFLDMELIENTAVIYFTKPSVGAKLKDEIATVLESFGKPEVIVNFDDMIGEGQKSELLAIGLPLVAEKAESVLVGLADSLVEAMKKEYEKSKKKDGKEDEDEKDDCK
jgi:hypothetical protein